MPVIVVEDALSANAPHLREARAHYIIGVKPGDHAFLFEHLRTLDEAGQIQVLTLVDPATGVLHHFRFCSAAPLNESNPDELVNVLEYWEIDPDGTVQHFSWITDLDLSAETVWDIMRGGRARWKIENETFNTLKSRDCSIATGADSKIARQEQGESAWDPLNASELAPNSANGLIPSLIAWAKSQPPGNVAIVSKNQGYHLEHNYGHGEQNLSVVLALLMMLAFLVDQVQQLCCPVFRAAWNKMKTKCQLWEELRSHFRTLLFDSMTELLMALVRGIAPQRPVFENST